MFRFLDRLQPLGLLVLRVTLGVIMIIHGKPKVFGGMPHMIDLVHKIGFPTVFAYLASYTEFVGGMLLVVGLLTRWAAIAIAIEMTVIIYATHFKWYGNFEFPLALGAIAFALIWFGAGAISVDRFFGKR